MKLLFKSVYCKYLLTSGRKNSKLKGHQRQGALRSGSDVRLVGGDLSAGGLIHQVRQVELRLHQLLADTRGFCAGE